MPPTLGSVARDFWDLIEENKLVTLLTAAVFGLTAVLLFGMFLSLSVSFWIFVTVLLVIIVLLFTSVGATIRQNILWFVATGWLFLLSIPGRIRRLIIWVARLLWAIIVAISEYLSIVLLVVLLQVFAIYAVNGIGSPEVDTTWYQLINLVKGHGGFLVLGMLILIIVVFTRIGWFRFLSAIAFSQIPLYVVDQATQTKLSLISNFPTGSLQILEHSVSYLQGAVAVLLLVTVIYFVRHYNRPH